MTKNSGANDPDKFIRTPDKLQKTVDYLRPKPRKMTSILLMGKANTKNVVTYKPSSNRFLNTLKPMVHQFKQMICFS